VAHEVRNPIFGISANLDAFDAKVEARSELRPLIARIRGEVERLSALMQDLLDYGRPTHVAAAQGAIDAVIAEAVGHCAALATERGVSVVNRVAPGLPPLLMDHKRLVRVFQNLLDNAIQHSPAGAAVTLDAGKEHEGGRTSVILSVQDSGPGFVPEDLPRVFEPFFSRRRGGTGLGLAIAQRIVEEHRGILHASNNPAGGATMVVKLPCERSAKADGGPEQRPS